MSETPHPPVHGRVDRDGRLVSADSRLLALQLGAGGDSSGSIAVPQLAGIVRLARTLGIPVSRNVMAADGDVDLELWVRAVPDAEGVRLTIGGWQPATPEAVDPALAAGRSTLTSELTAEGRWQCNARLVLTDASPEFSSNLGLSDPVGESIARLFRLIEDEAGDLPIITALAEPGSGFRQLVEPRAIPGYRGWLTGTALPSNDGTIAGFAGSFGWAEPRPPARLLPSAPQPPAQPFIERLDRALRAPLGRIIGEADTIRQAREGELDPQYSGYAQDIAAAGRHLLGLVDDMADLHAVERADFTIPVEPVDLADIARRAASLLGVRAADRNIRIDAPGDDEALMAMGDFRRALQIMVNLVSNAVRYTPPGSMVWIRPELEGDIAAIVVADMGKGIAPEDQTRIFERFERVDPSEPGGSGLGLYISRRLARAMGGDIGVDSAPGKGARFVLTLAAASQTDEAAATE